MIKSLLKIGLLLVAGILVYNFFFGTDEEKTQSKKVFGEMRDVARSVGSLIRTEREKFNQGKYDQALDKLGDAYQGIRKQAKHLDETVIKRLDAAEKRRQALEKELDSLNEPAVEPASAPAKNKTLSRKKQDELSAAKAADLKQRQEKLQRELESLQKEFEAVADEAERMIE